jgi:AbrB family looped-hinge helix DNA binding protein
MKGLIARIRERFFGEERSDTIDFMPKERRDMQNPKFKLRKEVNAQGQIYIPAEKRVPEFGSSVQEGDKYSLDVFAPDYGEDSNRVDQREIHVDVNTTSGYRITIPAKVRRELDIREGDTIAIHAYWVESEE